MAEISPYIRLFCEGGRTEPNYFNGYLKAKGFNAPNMASKPKDHSPKGIAKAALEEYKKAKRLLKIPENKIFIWTIFDRDGHEGIPEAINLLKGTPIGIAFSNICFEYWILLHYESTSKSFHNCDEVINYIRQKYDSEYGKANDHYQRLKDKISTGIKHAKQLAYNQSQYSTRPDSIFKGTNNHDSPDSPNWELNPYTDVHLIFESLREKGFIDTY